MPGIGLEYGIAGLLGEGLKGFADSYGAEKDRQRKQAEADDERAYRARKMEGEDFDSGRVWDSENQNYKSAEGHGFLSKNEQKQINVLSEYAKSQGEMWHHENNRRYREALERLLTKSMGASGGSALSSGGENLMPRTPDAAPVATVGGVSMPKKSAGFMKPVTAREKQIAETEALGSIPAAGSAPAPKPFAGASVSGSPYEPLKKKIAGRHAPGYDAKQWGDYVPKAEREQRKRNESDLLNIEMKEISERSQANQEGEKRKAVASLPANIRLQGESADTKGKIGLIKNALEAESKYIDAYNKGDRQNTLTPDMGIKLPLVGKVPTGRWLGVKSTPIDEARLMMVEGIGRLHSGGAINDDEQSRFEALIPTASDDPASYERKLKAYSDMMRSKLGVFGYSPEELGINLPEIKSAVPVTPTPTPSPTPSITPQATPQPKAPTVGTIEDGHEFLGGNPADPKSWRKTNGRR